MSSRQAEPEIARQLPRYVATGVLNTGGNLPGFLAPVVGLMIDQLGWLATLASGSLFAVTGAVLWLFVRLEPRSAPSRHPREP